MVLEIDDANILNGDFDIIGKAARIFPFDYGTTDEVCDTFNLLLGTLHGGTFFYNWLI